MPTLLPLEDALARILARARPTGAEEIALADGLSRVLAEPWVMATVDVPPFANSAMDGFALRAADTPGVLRLAGEVAAGAASLPPIEAGTTVRIMTGGPMPPGADTVVALEHAEEADGVVRVGSAGVVGSHVRDAGSDTPAGTELCLDEALAPAALGVLATLGLGRLRVRRRPLVAVISTGDELVEPGRPLGPGQIHDSNTAALAAAVADAGGEPLPGGHLADDPQRIERTLREVAGQADLIVTSGGVSVGAYDHVRTILERLGALDFWRIAVQPGKPLAVGELDGTTLIGLPGNPVSALVTFELFVRPLIRAMLGLAGDGRLHVRAVAESQIAKDPTRRAFLRVRLHEVEGSFVARAAGGQGSAQLRALADANALLVVPEGEAAAEPGATYDAIVLAPLTAEPS